MAKSGVTHFNPPSAGPAQAMYSHVVRMGNERGEIVLAAEAFDGVQGGEGINTLTSAAQGSPVGGAAFHDNHVWVRAA